MELRFQINDQVVERIQERTNIDKGSDIAKEALSMFDWATANAKEGCKIVAIDPSGNQTFWPVLDVTQRSARW